MSDMQWGKFGEPRSPYAPKNCGLRDDLCIIIVGLYTFLMAPHIFHLIIVLEHFTLDRMFS